MTRNQLVTACMCLAAMLGASLLPGCAPKQAVPAAGKAISLTYNLPKGKPLAYRTTEASTQTLEVMSRYQEIDTKKAMTYTITPGEMKENKQPLTVKVDSLAVALTTPQGDFSADVAQTVGKSFQMTLSSLGKETDLAGADSIKYTLAAAGTRSILSDFQAAFPDLPANPIKIGDTWTTGDTLDVNEGGMALKITTEHLNTLEAFEDLAGMKCLRIGITSKGTLKGEGEQQGMKLALDATMQGSGTWYFAPDKQVLAKFTSDVSTTGNINIATGGPQAMSIPMKQETKTETVLVK